MRTGTYHALNLASSQVGFIYSAVQLNKQALCVAFTFPKGDHCEPEIFHGGKPLAGRKVAEILPYLGDENLVSSSLALATVNYVSKLYAKPPEEVENLLPESQIAINTAKAIINNTIDHLLELTASCREAAVLRPSTPLLTEAFSHTTASCLSGISISEPEKVLQIIGEGREFRDFKY